MSDRRLVTLILSVCDEFDREERVKECKQCPVL